MNDYADSFYLARRRTTGAIRFRGAWTKYGHEMPEVGKNVSSATAQDVSLDIDYNDDDEEDSGWDVVKVFDEEILHKLKCLDALDCGVYEMVRTIVKEVDKAKLVASNAATEQPREPLRAGGQRLTEGDMEYIERTEK